MFEAEIERLLQMRPIPRDDIATQIAGASKLADSSDFKVICRIAYLDDVYDQLLAHPAMAVLPAWGSRGIDTLSAMAYDGPHSTAAFTVLTSVALGRIPTNGDLNFLPSCWDGLEKYKLDPQLPGVVQRRLRELVLEHLTDSYRKSRLLDAIAGQAMFQPNPKAQTERQDFLIEMLVDSQIIINKALINEFGLLLDAGAKREEQLHQFLVEHPVLLDPFVSELRSKHQLGDDFITDFIVRRINNEYLVVEIENSTDRLFNQDGSFSSDLSKAIAQVRDFQAWLSDNIAYAQTKLPGIRHPEGLVVIGRRKDLDRAMQTRLSEENFSRRGHIKIVTFDDLLSQALSVYQNMIERPTVLRARDQRSI